MNRDELKILLGCVGASFLSYFTYKQLRKCCGTKKSDWVPIGVVKNLYFYTAKSCKPKEVFSFYCGAKGSEFGESKDRHFQVINGETGLFYTMRQKPKMVLIDVTVENGLLHVTLPDGRTSSIAVDDIRKNNDVRKTFLHDKLRTDGYDCGDDISRLLSDFIEESNVRMVMYSDELFTERLCIPEQSWWNNNPVPKRLDNVGYQDLAPYMIQTEGSLHDLNSKLDEDVVQLNFRPGIVIDKCPAWDEDKWSELRIGEVELQCFKPCTRCVLTTVNPATGVKHPEVQPLKTLRKFRLAPAGPMLQEFKDSPLFGVNAGLVKAGYIHEGQVVYARYKPSAF